MTATTQGEAIVIYRRLLKFVDGFLAREKQSTLTTNGHDFMTYREIRRHIKEALKLKVSKDSRKPKEPK